MTTTATIPTTQEVPTLKKAKLPRGSIALEVLSLPPDGYDILALVLAPTLEVGMLAVQADMGQYHMSADAALLMLDALLSHLWELLPHVGPAFLLYEQARILRLKRAYQSYEESIRNCPLLCNAEEEQR